ncbi:unnamed protein product [Lactuca virosa]|uniref:Uncharacterized protein n=1 Tax=Lactuca virosa TaxID=75947 RepID=A0AAU9M456_9ASTR|nr:unnamed protein product [Lactuca virosa]
MDLFQTVDGGVVKVNEVKSRGGRSNFGRKRDNFRRNSNDRDVEVYRMEELVEEKALATDVSQAPQESPKTRELFNEDFESESEEQVLEEDEYESDGAQIVEVCGEY